MKKINVTTIRFLFFKYVVDIEKVLVSNKISFGKKSCKYFIGYLYNDHKVKLLHIMFPKTNAYVKVYNGQTKWMHFLIEDDDLLEKCNTIWDKVSASIKTKFFSESVFNKTFLETKIEFFGDEVTDFYDKEIFNHTCLSVINLDSALNKDGKYYQ